jgi:hypothetical protein
MGFLKSAGWAAVVAVLLSTAISTAAAQSANRSAVHSSSSQIRPYDPSRASNSKALPRSTVGASLPARANRSTTANDSELARLEHQTTTQLQAQSKHAVRPSSAGSVAQAHSERGSAINFSYHPARGSQMSRSSGSGSRSR